MLERFNPVLRLVCLVLAAVIVFQIVRVVTRRDPLADLALEPLAVLASTDKPLSNATTSGVSTNSTLTGTAAVVKAAAAASSATNSGSQPLASLTTPTNAATGTNVASA